MDDHFTVTVTHTIKEQDLKDVLITAIEGGINYWSYTTRYAPDEGLASITDPLEEETHQLTTHVLGRGVERIISGEVAIRQDLYEQVMTLLGEDPDVDADAADCIVQAGLFGEVIYG